MDYGRIIQEAWRLTWAHRFLWVFGLFAGASGGSCGFNYGQTFNTGGGGSNANPFDDPRLAGALAAVGAWVATHVGLIVAATLVLMLVGLVLIVLHFIATGALIASLARLATGQPATRTEGWSVGRRLGWTYARLTVLLFALVVGILVVVGVFVLLVVRLGAINPLLAVVVGVVLGLAGFVVAIAGGISVAIALAYAERAIAIDGLGARASLARGIALLRLRPGPSFLLWLVSLALGIAVSIALGVVAVVALVPLGGVVVAAFLSVGATAPTLAVGGLVLVIFVALLWLLVAVANVFSSAYWTLGYLSATGRWGAAPPPATAEPA